MKVVNRSQTLAILLTITLFGGFLFALVVQQDDLSGLRPYVQKFFTDFGEPDRLLNQRVAIQSGDLVTAHTSLMRTSIYAVVEGGLLDSHLIFQFGVIALQVLYTLLIMMIVIAMTRKVQYALVTGILVYTSPYFVFQSPFLIPQNVVLLFFLLMIWGFEKYRETGRVIFMVIVSASLLANTIYEPTSIIFNGVILLGYTLSFLFNEDPRKIEVTFITILVTLILMIPMFGELLDIVAKTLFLFGDNSLWGQYTASENLKPTVNTFLELVGYPVSIFGILGTVAIILKSWKKHLHLLVMLACILLLMLNVSPRVELSPNRMQSYLYLLLLLISAVYVSILFTRTGRLIRMGLISVLITFGIATMLTTPPWQRLNNGELQLAKRANQVLSENPESSIYIEADAMITTVLLAYPKQICTYWDPVFQWYVPPAHGDVPDCTQAQFRISMTGRNLPDYRIVRQSDVYSLYERIVNP